MFTLVEIAESADLSIEAVAYYERLGLLISAARDGGKCYTKADLLRLEIIATGKRLGFTLNEIKDTIDSFARTSGDLTKP